MKRILQATLTTAAILGGSAALSSCDSLIYDDQGDCTVHYRVPFTYTMNLLKADAFATQVTKVTLYVFDKEGNLVLQKSDSSEALSAPGYKMDIDLMPGEYDMLAWCEGTSPVEDHTAFDIGGGSRIADIDARLPLQGSAPDFYSDKDITPLYHGIARGVVCRDADYGCIDLPAIDLTKDTNVVKVILSNVDGREMKEDDFTVTVTSANSEMDYLNGLAGSTPVAYRPWSVIPVSSKSAVTSAAKAPSSAPTGLFTELTTGRLMTDCRTLISVTRNTDGVCLFSFNLIEYLVMVKGHYGSFTDQGYLDRKDEFSLTFFIDENLNWYTAQGIMIESWTVVPPQIEEV